MNFLKRFFHCHSSASSDVGRLNTGLTINTDDTVIPIATFTYDLIIVDAVSINEESYYYTKDVSIIKNLNPSIDYKYFRVNKTRCIYFTYSGICKVLFTLYESSIGIKFLSWYADYICKSYQSIVSEIFNKFLFPCVYLLHVDEYKGHINVYKFGRTDNFNRRYKELNRQYNTVFKIVTLQYIDPEFLSKAETEVQKRVVGSIIKIDNHTELFSINEISELIEFYKELGSKYNTKNKKLQEDITKLQYDYSLLIHKNTILELQMERKIN